MTQPALIATPPPATPRVILRDYQESLIAEVRGVLRSGVRRVCVVLPTGGGKTIAFCHIIAGAIAKGSSAIVFAHRRELIDQAYDKCTMAGIDPRFLGVVMARDPRRNPTAPVQIASIDTFRRRETRPTAKLIIIDEAHRSCAPSYLWVQEQYPEAKILGFSATPWRLDGKGLKQAYDRLVVGATIPQLIEGGYLVRSRVFSHPIPDTSGVGHKGGDFDPEALAAWAAENSNLRVGNAVEHWCRMAGGQRSILFAASVADSRAMIGAFVQAGVPAEHLDGETPAAQRKAILDRFRSGETILVSNVGILTEGFDFPLVKVVVVARPTDSRALWLQMIGRALRPIPGAPGADTALILDHAGCALRHGLPTDPQDYSLEGRGGGKGDRTPGTIHCPECFAALPAGTRVCPECNADLRDLVERAMREREGELQEIKDTEERRAKIEKRRCIKLRKQIQSLAHKADEARVWAGGTCNKYLYQRFGKQRSRMGSEELLRVLEYLGTEFDQRHPINGEAPIPLKATEIPSWLKEWPV